MEKIMTLCALAFLVSACSGIDWDTYHGPLAGTYEWEQLRHHENEHHHHDD